VSAPLRGVSDTTPGAELPRVDGTTVLVVDDDADGRSLVSHVLEAAGARVLRADSVAQAMEMLAEEIPDVVFTDLAMPGTDGFALLRAVRAVQRDPVPVIALTAYASEKDRRRVHRAGFNGFLAKPADPTALLRLVAELGSRGPR
jgi:CheY-like chemotaxis protein